MILVCSSIIYKQGIPGLLEHRELFEGSPEGFPGGVPLVLELGPESFAMFGSMECYIHYSEGRLQSHLCSDPLHGGYIILTSFLIILI